jgi:site-specific DNA-cytosine methylase
MSDWTFNGGPDRAADAAFLAVGRRRLTPDECAALQGFAPGRKFVGNKESVYRQIGNAVPPPLAEALAAFVAEALLR